MQQHTCPNDNRTVTFNNGRIIKSSIHLHIHNAITILQYKLIQIVESRRDVQKQLIWQNKPVKRNT